MRLAIGAASRGIVRFAIRLVKSDFVVFCVDWR
jgi:hypothetical protein